MSESNHTDEFEDYLRQQVGEHRMYPSDRVWKNIRGKIHTPYKWPALSVFTVLIISGLVIGSVIRKPLPDPVSPNFVYTLQSPTNKIQSAKDDLKTTTPAIDNNYSIDELTAQTITAATEKIKFQEAVALQLQHTDLALISNPQLININEGNINPGITRSIKNNTEKPEEIITSKDNIAATTFNTIDNYLFNVTSRLRSILNSEPLHNSGGVAFFNNSENDFELNYNNFNLNVPIKSKELLPSLDQLGKNSSRFDFRFYVTPSISYRKLDENDKSSNNDKTSGAAFESDYRIDPSKAINQSPALGYETGVGIGYKLNNKFTLTGGFQFNISMYKINAFLYKDEPIAVTLDNGSFSNMVHAVSNLRSIPGSDPITIKNRYYQISMPIGIEWNILNMGRFIWGMGTSIQPTYTFDKQPLIISSNYKNYADGSAYVRNWNLNANAETFIGYTTGSYRWQIGPQFRYQILPSLVDKYPNREYLLNYGLKVGVVKQLK